MSYMCILPGVLGMFHLELSKIRDFDYFIAITQNNGENVWLLKAA